MPPVKYEKTVDAGPAYDQLTHEPLADVRFAKLARERNATANHHARADIQVLHHRVMNWAAGIVEENVHAGRAGFSHRRHEVGGFFVIDRRIETDLAAPLEFVVVTGNGDGAAPG